MSVDISIDQIQYVQIVGKPLFLGNCWYNGESDEEGNIPILNKNKVLDFKIDVGTGKIVNWIDGDVAKIHYKVRDACDYLLLDKNGNQLISLNEYDQFYVPDFLDFHKGYGDYLIMTINPNGFIEEFDHDKMKKQLIEFIQNL